MCPHFSVGGGHELQWRGNYDEPGKREPDIAAIYNGMDPRETLEILDEYGIDYVYLGRLERSKFGAGAMTVDKLDRIMNRVFENGTTIIYGR